jgi:hypothetical protein
VSEPAAPGHPLHREGGQAGAKCHQEGA